MAITPRGPSTLLVVVLAFGAIVTGLVGILSLISPSTLLSLDLGRATPVTPGVLVYSTYNGSRNLALGAMLIALLVVRYRWRWTALAVVAIVIGISHLLDALAQVVQTRWAAVPGSVGFALIFYVAAVWLFRHRSTELD
jgi:hypothetical protein